MSGYTPAQARQVKLRIERQTAKIEDAAATLRHLVPDVDANRFAQHMGIDGMLEEFREVERGLLETVDRRTNR